MRWTMWYVQYLAQCTTTDKCMESNFTDLKNKTMTKEDFIEILDKYDSDFNLETGETIQAIYFQDFGNLAEELVKLFSIHIVSKSFYCQQGLGIGGKDCDTQCEYCKED